MNKICPNIQAGINEMGSRLSQVFFFFFNSSCLGNASARTIFLEYSNENVGWNQRHSPVGCYLMAQLQGCCEELISTVHHANLNNHLILMLACSCRPHCTLVSPWNEAETCSRENLSLMNLGTKALHLLLWEVENLEKDPRDHHCTFIDKEKRDQWRPRPEVSSRFRYKPKHVPRTRKC